LDPQREILFLYPQNVITRIIPSSGEKMPVIGLGTWQTFDVPVGQPHPALTEVLTTLQSGGGRLIDSSPMYGRSEQVIGELGPGSKTENDFFYATKVWITGKQEGLRQMEASFSKMKRKTMDLMQIHNLVDWKTHLPQLRQWKETGKIRYIGITHYIDSGHEKLEKIMRAEKIDFVQFNYSILSRHAEKRLLAAAADLGVATLINRPFGEGSLFKMVKGRPLPLWAKELEIESWAAFFLKYILSHPAVTCVIPATGDPVHAADNVKAGIGLLPDPVQREKMVEYLNR